MANKEAMKEIAESRREAKTGKTRSFRSFLGELKLELKI